MAVKIQELENKLDQKLAEQKPIIANLTNLWSAISTVVVLVLIGAVLVLVFPILLSGGSWLEVKIFGEDQSIEVEAPEQDVE